MLERDRTQAQERLDRLELYLQTDPTNLRLLSECAEVALTAGRADLTLQWLDRHAALAPLSPREINLKGLAALQIGDFASANDAFQSVLAEDPESPSLRFNLAWARAKLGDMPGALELLDIATGQSLPQAALLHVQLIHAQGEFEQAAQLADDYISVHPDHGGLHAAASVLAIDLEKPALAREHASRAGNHSDALTTLGVLALGEDRNAEALDFFTRALALNTEAPRAWIGAGLARLVAGEHAEAAREIEHGAQLFVDHSGSWIAAGWAHVLDGDLGKGRLCFQRALDADRSFSEPHGSLAVIDIMEGRMETARASTQTALRLDRLSFSGALAQSLLLSADGDPKRAHNLITRALHTPIDASGRTIAASLARYGLTSSL